MTTEQQMRANMKRTAAQTTSQEATTAPAAGPEPPAETLAWDDLCGDLAPGPQGAQDAALLRGWNHAGARLADLPAVLVNVRRLERAGVQTAIAERLKVLGEGYFERARATGAAPDAVRACVAAGDALRNAAFEVRHGAYAVATAFPIGARVRLRAGTADNRPPAAGVVFGYTSRGAVYVGFPDGGTACYEADHIERLAAPEGGGIAYAFEGGADPAPSVDR